MSPVYETAGEWDSVEIVDLAFDQEQVEQILSSSVPGFVETTGSDLL